MANRDGAVMPIEFLDKAVGCSVGRLLEIDRERNVVVVVVGGLERGEETGEGARSIHREDRDVDAGGVPVCARGEMVERMGGRS